MANPTADALTARAKALRTDLATQTDATISPRLKEMDEVRRTVVEAEARATKAQEQLTNREEQLQALQREGRKDELEAAEAEAAGMPQVAQEQREQAARIRVQVQGAEERAAIARTELAEARQQHGDLTTRIDTLTQEHIAAAGKIEAAEASIDAMEARAEYLVESDGHAAESSRLHQEADRLRAAGKTEDADAMVRRAVDQGIAAQAKRGSADEQVIDDAALTAIGLPAVGPIPAPPPLPSQSAPDEVSLGEAGATDDLITAPATASAMAAPLSAGDLPDGLAPVAADADDALGDPGFTPPVANDPSVDGVPGTLELPDAGEGPGSIPLPQPDLLDPPLGPSVLDPQPDPGFELPSDGDFEPPPLDVPDPGAPDLTPGSDPLD